MTMLGCWRLNWHCIVLVATSALLSCIDGTAAAGADKASARDHYEVLGLTREASQAEIKRAHKRLALQYHPDKNRKKEAENMFIEIQKAYEMLGDPERRRRYDKRSRFFSEEAPDDTPSGEEGTENAPDGGRGTPFDTVQDLREAVSNMKLHVMHVYTDQGNIFGSWMERLPPEFQLGHVNLQRNPSFNTALREMHGGHFGSVPLLMVCQRSRCRSFRPSMGFFFDPFQSVVSSVVEEALSLVDYWEHVSRLRSDGGLQSFCDFSPGHSAKLRVIFIVEDQDELYWSLFSAASRMHRVAHFAQLRYFDAADAHGYPHNFLARFGVASLPAAVFLDPVTGAHATVSGRRASDSVASITERLFLGERVSSKLFMIPELDDASYLARCELGDGCQWLVLLATSSSFEATTEFTHAWGAFIMACQSLSALQAQLPGAPVCFWLRLGRASAWSALLEAAGFHPGMAVTAAVLDGRHLAIAPEGATSNHRMLFRWIRDAISGRVQSHTLPKNEWPPFPPSLERHVNMQESIQARLEAWMKRFAWFWHHATAAYAPLFHWLLGWVMVDPLTALGIVLLMGSLVALAWSWIMEDESEPSIKDVLQDLQFQVTCTLHRKDEQAQLGFGINGHKDGGLEISSVSPGSTLDLWFANCGGRPERQVREGDRIVCASFPDTGRGKFVHAHCPQAMKRALREARDVTLTVTPSASRLQGLRLLLGHVQLDGLTLKSSMTLAYGSRSDGFRHDLEVIHIGPEVAAWNAERCREGACCSQCLELGDQVVAVGRHTHVMEHLAVLSPEILVAKWRPAGAIRVLQLEVALERANPDDGWGMQLRKFCSFDAKGTFHVSVRKIVPGKLADYNTKVRDGSCENRQVHVGDRLLAVNGFRNLQQMTVELKRSKVALLFERWLEKKACEAQPPMEGAHLNLETSQVFVDDSGAGASKHHEGKSEAATMKGEGLSAAMGSFEEDGWAVGLENLACDGIGSYVQTPVCNAGTCFASMNPASLSTSKEGADAMGFSKEDACPYQRAALAARRQQAPQKSVEVAAPAPAVQVKALPFKGLDEDEAWIHSCSLCVIAARGSPLYLSGVLALRDVLQPVGQVKFYSEQRLPLASLLVALPKESRCRWFHLPSLEPHDGHSCNEVLSATFVKIERLVQQVLHGDTGLLPICFDPADFASHNFGACLVSPVDVSSDQKLE